MTHRSSAQRAELREDLADFDAALAVLLEREGRLQQIAGLALRLQIARGHRLAVVLRQHRLGIERVHLRRPAVQEQVDDALRLGGKVRRLGRKRISTDRHCVPCSEHACHPHHAESGAHRSQHFTAVHSVHHSVHKQKFVGGQQHARILGPVRLAQEIRSRASIPARSGSRPYTSRYASRIFAESSPLNARRQRLRLLLDKRTVHQEQPLRRNVRAHPRFAGAHRRREVEQREHPIQLAAADETVNRAFRRLRQMLSLCLRPASQSSLPDTNSIESRSDSDVQPSAIRRARAAYSAHPWSCSAPSPARSAHTYPTA